MGTETFREGKTVIYERDTDSLRVTLSSRAQAQFSAPDTGVGWRGKSGRECDPSVLQTYNKKEKRKRIEQMEY